MILWKKTQVEEGMRRTTKIMMVLLCVGLAGLSAAGQSEGGAEKIVIKVSHDNAVQTPGHAAFVRFKEIVEAESEGRIEVQIFPGGQLGSVQDMFEQTRRGDIQMSVGATTLFTQTIPEFAVWDSFYMFDDAAHAHRVLDGKAGLQLMEPLERMDLVGIGYMEIGFRNFSNSKRPIVNPEDVKGLKIRGYSPMQIAAWESVGCSLTNLSWSEVFTSLQQNLIDGQECATSSFYDAKFYEAQEYWSLTRHIYTNWLWYANKEFMDSLSAADRAIVERAAQQAIALDRELMSAAETETLNKLPGLGIEVNEVPLETRLAMGEKMNGTVSPQIIEKCGQEIYDMVKQEIVNERQ
jgi:TRAP-type transport system periplasmic protein